MPSFFRDFRRAWRLTRRFPSVRKGEPFGTTSFTLDEGEDFVAAMEVAVRGKEAMALLIREDHIEARLFTGAGDVSVSLESLLAYLEERRVEGDAWREGMRRGEEEERAAREEEDTI